MMTKEYLDKYDLVVYQPSQGYRYNEDSIQLVEFVQKIKKRAKVVDLGAGTGIISLILAKKFPDCLITAVEIEALPYEFLLKNIRENHLSEQITPILADWKTLKKEHCQYDVAISNPPFRVPGEGRVSIKPEKASARHETKGGLEDLLDTVRVILREKGVFYAVYLSERLVDIFTAMRTRRIEPKEIKPIYPKQDSHASTILIKGIKGGGRELKILPPFFRR